MAVYSKTLTRTDTSCRLEVNANCLRGFFPAFEAGQDRQVLVVEDEIGKNWEFSLRIRQQKHKKPYISQATWLPFVVDKHAEVGDEVEFSWTTDGASGSAGRYKIRVMKNEKREVKLFGVIIGHAELIPNN